MYCVIKSSRDLYPAIVGFVGEKFASSYLQIVRNKPAFIVWHDRSGIDTGTCLALESFQSSVTVDFLRQRFALTRIRLLLPSALTPPPPATPPTVAGPPFSNDAALSRPPYLYLSIFFSLHSRHAYVCTEYKGIKRGKRLYRELLRCLARRGAQNDDGAGRRFSISHLGGPDYRPSGYVKS